jgi:DNA ligase D-like protein (predicted 3'-phosphoesterase)
MQKLPKYSIHEHHARQHHYDLRLEKDGVLKSWAVPKEPNEKDKRLAVQVEDHELGYAYFEGIIPEGEYGAGTVKLWDKGTYEAAEWAENKIVMNISGGRLNGTYCLIRLKRSKNWLFFKKQ